MTNATKKTLFASTIITVLLFILIGGFQTVPAKENIEDTTKGPTINILDEIADSVTAPERPAVLFPHDLHTIALGKAKGEKACTECHLKKENRVIQKFKRTSDQSQAELTDLYHDNCIGCHQTMAARNEQTGPVECGLCHARGRTEQLPEAVPVFDKSLHYRHVKENDSRCELCHHQYNEQEKQLYYKKGAEASCRYCHKEYKENNTEALKVAFHTQCLNCHLGKMETSGKKLPNTCQDCHTHDKLDHVKKIALPPRIQRNQPDLVVIKKGEQSSKFRMAAVPFDHQRHEAASATCIACHHASMAPCASCHVVGMPEKMGDIPLEQAMHTREADFSCIGCHLTRQRTAACAGCHNSAPVIKASDEARCLNCHAMPSKELPSVDQTILKQYFETQTRTNETFDEASIPEKVIIDSMSKKYEAAVMPHRKIIKALNTGIKADHLATFFHQNQFTTCKGCHHEVPDTMTPSKCSHCHFPESVKTVDDKIGLMGAYHNQCMDCHKAMDIETTGCVDCHKEKK